MQTTTIIDAPRRRGAAAGLLDVLAGTRALRQQTRELRRIASGPMSRALRVMLSEQLDELRLAEAALTSRTSAFAGTAMRGWSGRSAAPGSDRSALGARTFEDALLALVDTHEKVACAAASALKIVEVARDPPTRDLLRRRSDAHLKSAWLLTFVGMAAIISRPESPAT